MVHMNNCFIKNLSQLIHPQPPDTLQVQVSCSHYGSQIPKTNNETKMFSSSFCFSKVKTLVLGDQVSRQGQIKVQKNPKKQPNIKDDVAFCKHYAAINFLLMRQENIQNFVPSFVTNGKNHHTLCLQPWLLKSKDGAGQQNQVSDCKPRTYIIIH